MSQTSHSTGWTRTPQASQVALAEAAQVAPVLDQDVAGPIDVPVEPEAAAGAVELLGSAQVGIHPAAARAGLACVLLRDQEELAAVAVTDAQQEALEPIVGPGQHCPCCRVRQSAGPVPSHPADHLARPERWQQDLPVPPDQRQGGLDMDVVHLAVKLHRSGQAHRDR